MRIETIRTNCLIAAFAAFCVLPSSVLLARAQQPASGSGQKATAGIDPAAFDRLRVTGFEAVYNTDYATARDAFVQMTKVQPSHPAGYLYLANNIWLETLYASRRLTTSVYTGSSFYAETAEDKVDPKRDAEFTALIKQSMAASAARLAKNNKDAEALYYQASAYGVRAAYGTSVKRSFARAIADANDSVQLHKQVVKIDPTYIDSYLSIGLYEYILANLPAKIRVPAAILGLKGSKKKGIEHLEQVAKDGKYTPDDAKVVLIAIYSNEGQPERALQSISELSAKYPRNNLFKVERARMLYNLGRADEGAQIFAELLKDERIESSSVDLVNYQWAEALMKKGDHASALEKSNAVIKWPKSNGNLVTLSHLQAGEALDATGKRDEALAQYKIVLQRDNVFDSHKQATQFSGKAYTSTGK